VLLINWSITGTELQMKAKQDVNFVYIIPLRCEWEDLGFGDEYSSFGFWIQCLEKLHLCTGEDHSDDSCEELEQIIC